jgi:hypothetical protein
VLLGNGDGTFQPAITTHFGAALGQLADFQLADVNGDGKLDIVAVNSFGAQPVLSVALGNGDGTFRSPYAFSAPGFIPNSLTVGDFNGDGVLDAAIASSETFFDPESGEHFTTGAVTIFPGIGGGFFGAPTVINPVPGAGSIATGDFTGSGHLDLLTVNSTFGNHVSISVLPGHGDGTFGPPITTPAPQGPLGPAVVADFNGNGILDVAAVNPVTNSVSVFLGNGDGTFQAPLEFAVGANPHGLAVGDFNGDGFPDLVTANFGASRSLSVLLNDASWGAAPGGRGGPPRGSRLSLDLFPLPGVAEPAVTPGWSWAPTTPATTSSPIAAAPFQERTHPAVGEIRGQPPEFVAEDLFSWPFWW